MVNNLTEEKLLKLPFFFAMPMVVGNLLQQLYNMMDSMVVGRLVGKGVLAAVGSPFPVVFLPVATTADTSMGCTIVILQFFGMGKIFEMKITTSTALVLLGVIGLIIMGIGEITVRPLLILLGADPDVVVDFLAYLRIYFGGAIFLSLCNFLNGTYSALGDNQTPLKFLMISTLTDIILDLLFAIQFSMGVVGVAWATLAAQGVCAAFSFLVSIAHLGKLENEEASRGKVFTFFGRSSAERIAKVGVPSMFQQFIVSISMMLIQGLVNSYRKVLMTSYTAAIKIDTPAMTPNMNPSNAMPSYVAQSVGARKMDHAKQGHKASMFMVVVFSFITISIILLFGPQLLGLFLKRGSGSSVMSYGLSYMRTVSMSYILMGALFVSSGLLRGIGDMGTFMPNSVVNLFSRVVTACLLAYFIGSSAIWWFIPTGWTIGTSFSFLRVRSGKWMAKRLVD